MNRPHRRILAALEQDGADGPLGALGDDRRLLVAWWYPPHGPWRRCIVARHPVGCEIRRGSWDPDRDAPHGLEPAIRWETRLLTAIPEAAAAAYPMALEDPDALRRPSLILDGIQGGCIRYRGGMRCHRAAWMLPSGDPRDAWLAAVVEACAAAFT